MLLFVLLIFLSVYLTTKIFIKIYKNKLDPFHIIDKMLLPFCFAILCFIICLSLNVIAIFLISIISLPLSFQYNLSATIPKAIVMPIWAFIFSLFYIFKQMKIKNITLQNMI